MSEDFIDGLFVGVYPGTNKPLSGEQTNAALAAPSPTDDVKAWGNPHEEVIGGVPILLYHVGDLARALGRSSMTIRSWETRGVFPKPPYTIPPRKGGLTGARAVAGKRRGYSAQSIQSCMEIFKKYNVLHAVRVPWSSPSGKAMTREIFNAWQEELREFISQANK